MTNREKFELMKQVKFGLVCKETHSEIITRLAKQGYKRETIRKYIKACAK